MSCISRLTLCGLLSFEHKSLEQVRVRDMQGQRTQVVRVADREKNGEYVAVMKSERISVRTVRSPGRRQLVWPSFVSDHGPWQVRASASGRILLSQGNNHNTKKLSPSCFFSLMTLPLNPCWLPRRPVRSLMVCP